MKIITKCIYYYHIPAEYMPLIITRSYIRLLTVSRVNKQHTLYNVSGDCIRELESNVKEQQSKLALASTIIQFGNANFDAFTSTTLLATLLDGLDEHALYSYVEFLCQMLYDGMARVHALPTDSNAMDVDVDADVEDGNQEKESVLTNMNAALELLVIIAKSNCPSGNTKSTNTTANSNTNTMMLKNKLTCNMVLTVLLRLACFSSGSLCHAFSTPNVTSVLFNSLKCTALLSIIEHGTNTPPVISAAASSTPSKKHKKKNQEANHGNKAMVYEDSIVQKAQKLLIQLLSDTGHIDNILENNLTGKEKEKVRAEDVSCVTSVTSVMDVSM